MNVFKSISVLSYSTAKLFELHLILPKSYTRLGLSSQVFGISDLQSRRNCVTTSRHSDAKGGGTLEADEISPRPNVTSSKEAHESIRLQKIKQTIRLHFKNIEHEASQLKAKDQEFEIGRRHLANMMGMDANTFTQQDIDRAIEYLMPSGLFEPKARPIMKPPREINPVPEGLQLDETGRPINPFFYTGRANFYSVFHKISNVFEALDMYEDKMIARGFVQPPPEAKISIGDSQWLNLDAMRKLLSDESLPETDYNYLIGTLERLVDHPYSFRAKDFILKYRASKPSLRRATEIKPLTVGEDGIPYAEGFGTRKWTRASVKVMGKGTGKVTINGLDISYFSLKQDREQLLTSTAKFN